MISLTAEAILAFMKKIGYDASIQAETDQVYTVFKMEQKEYPLFIRIFDEGHLLQLLAFIPSLLESNARFNPDDMETHSPADPEKKAIIADMARLLHILNRELDVPGFGMDEMAGVVFYRLMLPTPKKKIEPDLLQAFLKTTEHICKMFSAPIEALSSGKLTLDEILAKAENQNEQPAP